MTDNSTTLHILNKRPDHHRFQACLDALGPGDVLLLIENGVIALTDAGIHLPEGTHVLQADCEARGLATGPEDEVEQVDYLGMVYLTDRFSRVISW